MVQNLGPVRSTPEEFKNDGFILKMHQMFSLDMHLTYLVFICSYTLVRACLVSCSNVIAFIGNF